jgi:energy-coupling factor transporter ATP-binding protein EcfA2
MKVIAELDRFSYSYPSAESPALQNIRLRVLQGELLGIIGPSGAGKSSLGYTLSGFIPLFFHGDRSGGQILLGQDVESSTLGELAGQVGMVVQNPFNQISGARYTVREEAAFGLENLGVSRGEMTDRVEESLIQFKLIDQADRSPFALSGGQQQRLALASIFVMQPDLLILDEPTSQLDPAGTEEVFEAVYNLTEGGNTTVVLISHKLEWLAEFASRVIAIHEGKIQLDGDPARVLTDPKLEEWGIGSTQYTRAAQLAAREEIIRSDQLPITLQQAQEFFQLR